ncbi:MULTISPECIES: hypothetical protein [Actinoplanes]|uniref:hypothetical protein n=1 Tax=Actinoplanes TaxID=1865 RepID=UPI000695F76F|nr:MULTISPECIES: hypothetical protein [Actinoplanes]GLY04005.1 hypothetical protein Acsp01_43840 [Actinoplanes sp. NBRC 101535]
MSVEPVTGPQTGVPDRLRWPWYLSGWLTVASTATFVAAGGGITAFLWHLAGTAPADEQVGRYFDAVTFGATAAAGAGVVAGLILQFRRQRMAEHTHVQEDRKFDAAVQAQRHTEADASARRLTETLTRATEQFAADNTVVRLAGLYAFERLAQENPDQRQMIVNLLCAFLRAPVSEEPAGFGFVTFHRRAIFAEASFSDENAYLAGARQVAPRGSTPSQMGSVWPDGWAMGDDGVLTAVPDGPDGTWLPLPRLPESAGSPPAWMLP